MTYDYHGSWDKKTGHLAPIYYIPGDDYDYFNVVRIVRTLVRNVTLQQRVSTTPITYEHAIMVDTQVQVSLRVDKCTYVKYAVARSFRILP